MIFRLKSIIEESFDSALGFFSTWSEMYNKANIGLAFCDMQNYQCLGKSYQPSKTLIILQQPHPIIV